MEPLKEPLTEPLKGALKKSDCRYPKMLKIIESKAPNGEFAFRMLFESKASRSGGRGCGGGGGGGGLERV